MVIHSNIMRRLPEEARRRFIKVFGEIVPMQRILNVILENLSYANRGYGKTLRA